jgi:hypothetical protein
LNKNDERIVALFPLGNFELEKDFVAISEEANIRKLTKKESSRDNRTYTMVKYLYGIEVTTDSLDTLNNLPQLLLTALRLNKSGLVGWGDECIIKKQPSTISDSKISEAIAQYLVDPMEIYGSPYILKTSEVPSFRKFFNHLSTIRHDVSTIIAFWKFNEAMEEHKIEYQFLDLVVVLETLCTRDERGEKKEKLARRISTLLGNSQFELDWIHDKVVQWYIYRNEMLHSGYPSSNSLDKVNLVIDCTPLEEIARRSLISLIALWQKSSKAELWHKLTNASARARALARSLLELQAETNDGWVQKICKRMILVEGNFEDRSFDLQAWMQKTAESKRCKSAKWKEGRVIELAM